jgi:hypothetical protein
MPKLQEKPSALKREHPALQKIKILSFFYFFGSFLPSWIRIRIRNLYADPDPAAQINADPSGYGSGSETLPGSVQIIMAPDLAGLKTYSSGSGTLL